MKRYMKPAIHMAEIELENMIATSLSDTLQGGDGKDITNGNEFESKNNYGDVSSWDEEDEDDNIYTYRHKSMW